MATQVAWWVGGGILGACVVVIGVTTAKPDSFLGLILGMAVALATLAAAIRKSRQASARWKADVRSPEFLAITALLDLTREERLYCQAVGAVMEAEALLDGATRRDLLRQLKSLIQASRQLEAARERVRAAMGANSLAELRAERAGVARRLDQAADPQARQALQQSLERCGERLENARGLEPNLERIHAHQELIVQTLTSVQATLSRAQTERRQLGAPAVEEMQRTAALVNSQARAVEEAVHEVVTLSAG